MRISLAVRLNIPQAMTCLVIEVMVIFIQLDRRAIACWQRAIKPYRKLRLVCEMFWQAQSKRLSGQCDHDRERQILLRAQALLDAIDQGGIPTSPILINRIARNLGLEVALSAPIPETILRIRTTLMQHSLPHAVKKPWWKFF